MRRHDDRDSPENPFLYLRKDGFWRATKHGASGIESVQIQPLLGDIGKVFASFKEGFEKLTIILGNRQKMREALVSQYFPNHAATLLGAVPTAELLPMAPMVAEEEPQYGRSPGLDFHSYCCRIVHWNLPGNPVDLEQREGRINRYKSLVICQQLGKKYRAAIAGENLGAGEDIWKHLFRIADVEERQNTGKSELIPYWHIDPDPENGDSLKIERVIPLYPFSIDRSKLLHILRTLAIYRLAFGQPRQAELVDHLLDRKLTPEEQALVMKTLMIDLSPIRYNNIS